MPSKSESCDIQDHLNYSKNLINIIKKEVGIQRDEIILLINYLEEIVEDDIEYINSINDKDAKTGHKTQDTSFLDYKTHIGMSEERIITSAIVTTGEKLDGKETKSLIEQSNRNGMEVEVLIGDGAYSEKNNIEYCEENHIKLVSKLSKTITENMSKDKDNFYYNKDAGMFVCQAGHMAIKKIYTVKRKMNQKVKSFTNHISLMFKDVNNVLIKRAVIKKVRLQKVIL